MTTTNDPTAGPLVPLDAVRDCLKRHHSFTNLEAVRCFCGAVLGPGTALHWPALSLWIDHICAVLAAGGAA